MEAVKTSRIYLAAFAANISYISLGTCIGWTSPVLVKLKAQDTSDSPLSKPITASEEAWISSIIALAALFAPFVGGPLADKIGRKGVLLSSSVFYIIAFVLLLFAFEFWILLLGRFMQGIAVGFVMTVLPMYVGEICTDSVRGGVGTLNSLSMQVGILYAYAIGPFVSYNALQYFCLALPIVFVSTFFFMPESPYYYVAKGKMAEALKSLQFLRGQSMNVVQNELAQIQASVELSKANKGSIADVFKFPGNRKALLIAAGLVAFQQLTGVNVVTFNSQSIFESAKVGLSSALSTIIVGLILFAGSAVAPFIADRLNRRTIFLTSAAFMFLGLGSLGIFFYIESEGGDVSNLSWLPLTALIIFCLAQVPGFGALSWAVMGEIFSMDVKSIASALAAASCSISTFIVTFIYPLLVVYGSYYVFWMHAIICVMAFFFAFFVVIETKGLSLQQIQDKLNGKEDMSSKAEELARIGKY